jgi:hypothetical protein
MCAFVYVLDGGSKAAQSRTEPQTAKRIIMLNVPQKPSLKGVKNYGDSTVYQKEVEPTL